MRIQNPRKKYKDKLKPISLIIAEIDIPRALNVSWRNQICWFTQVPQLSKDIPQDHIKNCSKSYVSVVKCLKNGLDINFWSMRVIDISLIDYDW